MLLWCCRGCLRATERTWNLYTRIFKPLLLHTGLLPIEPETQGFRMTKGAPEISVDPFRISRNHTEVAVFVDYLCSAQHHYLLLLAFQGGWKRFPESVPSHGSGLDLAKERHTSVRCGSWKRRNHCSPETVAKCWQIHRSVPENS